MSVSGYTKAGADAAFSNRALSNLTSVAAARNTLKVAASVTPEQYGAAGDGVTNDTVAVQAAIDALAAANGGTVLFDVNKHYVLGGVIRKTGVFLMSSSRTKNGTVSTGCLITPPAGFVGYVFDSPSTPISNEGMSGFSIIGAGPTADQGAVRLQNGAWNLYENISASGFSRDTMHLAGVGYTVRHCLLQTDASAITLTDFRCALYLGGSDYTAVHNQCNANNSGAVSYPSNFYRVGLRVAGYYGWVYDNNGEFGDVGVLVDGNHNKIYGARGDFNRGHGIWVAGLYNQLFGVGVIDNGQAADNTYDGLWITGQGNKVWGCMGSLSTGGNNNRMRYIVNDASVTTADLAYTNQSEIHGVGGELAAVGTDYLNQSFQYAQVWSSGYGPASNRPPSRYMAGGTWWDVTLGKMTFSDGATWRDSTGAQVGNLLTPNGSVGRDASTYTSDNGTTSVIARIDGHTGFGTPKAYSVTANAAGAAAGQAYAVEQSFPAVTAGGTYRVVASLRAVATGRTVTLGVNWYNVSNALISTTQTALAADSTAAGAVEQTTTFTAPALATSAQVFILWSGGVALNEVHQFGKVALIPGSAINTFIRP